jgi:hypothetical protein
MGELEGAPVNPLESLAAGNWKSLEALCSVDSDYFVSELVHEHTYSLHPLPEYKLQNHGSWALCDPVGRFHLSWTHSLSSQQ